MSEEVTTSRTENENEGMPYDDSPIEMGTGIVCIDFANAPPRTTNQTIVRSIGRKSQAHFNYIFDSGKMTEEEKKARELEELDEKYGLPETWNRNSQQRTKADNCAICETGFSLTGVFGVGTRDFSCK